MEEERRRQMPSWFVISYLGYTSGSCLEEGIADLDVVANADGSVDEKKFSQSKACLITKPECELSSAFGSQCNLGNQGVELLDTIEIVLEALLDQHVDRHSESTDFLRMSVYQS